jgi:hypothetical protein
MQFVSSCHSTNYPSKALTSEEVEGSGLLSVVNNDSAARRNNVLWLAVSADLAETAPLTKESLGGHSDQVDRVLGAELRGGNR